MNKYLLLRDNKQSGPYTVPEIIQIGIKPYDLVWLDGKSAAWRYPSEIEELKAYAPTVEEQPFDRFYKKPEAVKTNTPEVYHTQSSESDYQPKISSAPSREETQPSKKVYINFPGRSQTPAPVRQPVQPSPINENTKENAPVFPERVKQSVHEEKSSWNQEHTHSTSVPSSHQAADRKLLYGAIAACIILVGFITVILINYFNQQASLKELNTIVKKMESKGRPADGAVTASLVNSVEPPASNKPTPVQTSETIVNPEVLLTPEETATPENIPVVKEKVILPPKTDRVPDEKSGIVFKEKKPSIKEVSKETEVKEENAPATASSSENLFKLVTVKPNQYKTGVLGGISNLQFELTNNSMQELHKVAIEIKYLGPEKKIVRRQTVYFENVAPGQQATIDVPKSSRGVSIDYTIIDIKS